MVCNQASMRFPYTLIYNDSPGLFPAHGMTGYIVIACSFCQ